MQSEEIRRRFLLFFGKRGHAIIPSASLVPENDPSVLFTTAGMQPLAPFLLGEPHPKGRRLANVQKCVRTQDIDEVGDNTHDTFFEMLGNWSLGDYFKKEAIEWSYEFLTSKEEGLGLDPARLYVTVFEGDENAPRDEGSFSHWRARGVPENHIYFLGAKSNWWSPGDNGPCGPDTEMFYDITEQGLNLKTKEEFLKADERQEVVEIWNDVFMEYQKKDSKVVGKLQQHNVDTGAGLERLAMVLQKKDNIFETDLFDYLIKGIRKQSHTRDTRAERIVADHIRTAVFMVSAVVVPSNTDRGYILRRLIRRAVFYAENVLGITTAGGLPILYEGIIQKYEDVYPELREKKEVIRETITEEIVKFKKTVAVGLIEIKKLKSISGKDAFVLFSTHGFPFEMTKEIALERGITVNEEEFRAELSKHQDLSRKGAEQKFKGGLADHSEMSVKYHTTTHLLHRALRDVLGKEVFQKGSNITSERLRFDFSFGRKMTDEDKKKVEDIINQKIKESLSVTYEDIPMEEAEKRGAIGLFEEKYGDLVRVYKIGDFSLEFCGGPHVKNTNELGIFKIIKEEAVSSGIRRIKAVLE